MRCFLSKLQLNLASHKSEPRWLICRKPTRLESPQQRVWCNDRIKAVANFSVEVVFVFTNIRLWKIPFPCSALLGIIINSLCHVLMMFCIIILCSCLLFWYPMNWGHHPGGSLQRLGPSCPWWRSGGRCWGRGGRGCPRNPPSFSPPSDLHPDPPSMFLYQQFLAQLLKTKSFPPRGQKRGGTDWEVIPRVKRVFCSVLCLCGVFSCIPAKIDVTNNYICIYQQQKQ